MRAMADDPSDFRLSPTGLGGCWSIEPLRKSDERGYFVRTFCAASFAAMGLETSFVQRSVSFNRDRATLRGLHFQAAPHGETKIVRCTRGAVYDVAVDLRPGSPTFKRHVALELSAESGRILYIPAGFAHGFLTVQPDSEVYYEITPAYVASAARGVAWNDPELAIGWPTQPSVMSERDRALPRLAELARL